LETYISKRLGWPAIAAASLILLSAAATAQTVPEKGTITCQQSDVNQLPSPAGAQKAIMVSNTVCSFDGVDPSIKTSFNNVLEIDMGAAKAKTISSTGTVSKGDKVTSVFTIEKGDWTLQLKDGQMVGWSSEGSSAFKGGEFAGRSMSWSAKATGPNTFKLDYVVQK